MELLNLEQYATGTNFIHLYKAIYYDKQAGVKNYELISRDSNLTLEKFKAKPVPTGVNIIAFNSNRDKLLVQREFRMSCNKWVYTFPCGLIDSGETVEQAATRELREETGLQLDMILNQFPASYISIGDSCETVVNVLCTASGKISNSDSPMESIYAKWVSRGEADQIARTELATTTCQSFLYMWNLSDQIRMMTM